MTDGELVRLHREGRVAYVTLDRPEASNLVTRAMMEQLVDNLTSASKLAELLVVQANGEHFTLGRDQSERPAGVSPADNLALILEVNRLLAEFDGVTIALVRGRALGFGSGLALHSDIVVASDTAVFGFDEIAHGFPPLLVLSYLSRYLPLKPAFDLVLTGRWVPALEARALGMVSRVVPDADLEATGAALSERLAGFDIQALRRAKRFFREIEEVPREERSSYALDELVEWGRRDDESAPLGETI